MPVRQDNPYDTSGGDAPTGTRPDSTQPIGPIGVPYYVTDPTTGLPQVDPVTGEKVRWQANVPMPASGPGSYGTQGPGTAPSSGYKQVAPRYFTGDDRRPAQMEINDMIMLQKYMISIGLVPQSTQVGIWDKTWADAYSKVLGFANSSGLTDAEALQRWGEQALANPPAGPPRKPLTVQLTNPDDLRKVVQASVVDTLGQGWDSARIDNVVSSIQAGERDYQTQAYNMEESGGTVTAPPDPSTFAATQARQADPLLAQEHDLIKQGGPLDSFKQILGGWA